MRRGTRQSSGRRRGRLSVLEQQQLLDERAHDGRVRPLAQRGRRHRPASAAAAAARLRGGAGHARRDVGEQLEQALEGGLSLLKVDAGGGLGGEASSLTGRRRGGVGRGGPEGLDRDDAAVGAGASRRATREVRLVWRKGRAPLDRNTADACVARYVPHAS